MKVLVAEDSKYYCTILETTLVNWGYEVITAKDGQEAWQILQEETCPQLVILDWVMPKMSGVDVCKAVRSTEKNSYSYIILLTSLNGKENILTGLQSGADDYIIKPFDEQELKYRLKIGERIICLENKILHLALIDYLTGALNRRAFIQRLESEIQRSRRLKLPVSLIMMDIDNFKSVNDNYGHQVGDHVLKSLAEEVNKNIRSYDILGRYGGEEFIICLPEIGLSQAKGVAERLRQAIEKYPFKIRENKSPIYITSSFGISSLAKNQEEVENFIRRADDSLFQAKTGGKNRIVVSELYYM